MPDLSNSEYPNQFFVFTWTNDSDKAGSLTLKNKEHLK